MKHYIFAQFFYKVKEGLEGIVRMAIRVKRYIHFSESRPGKG